MKYVVLIYGNPESRRAWEGMSDEQRAAGLAHYQQLNDDLDASGERIVSERLAFPELTTQVSVSDGAPMTTDGPFAEAKEFLAGFYLLDCESHERAVEIAGRIPEASFGVVEVRPVMGLHGPEL
ncbi:YciI family protein [Amycolatopsis sp. cmx-4-68]|uniref:YciI family protein n=1 Tax=Amycolatopsis sp. cmx-4-68 TaxID=2790938 RepID=UPI00397DB30E